jgi:hypothetical protein
MIISIRTVLVSRCVAELYRLLPSAALLPPLLLLPLPRAGGSARPARYDVGTVAIV